MIAYLPLSMYKFGQSLLNFGIPGDTTTGVLYRLSQVIDLKPLKVWIHVGSNDLVLSDLSEVEIAENILKIRDMLIEKIEHVKVYIISITPVLRNHSISNMRYIEWRTNDEIKEINQMLQNHLMKGEYINVFDLLIDSYGNLNIDYTKDGIHLNGEGYKVFIDEIKTLI